jgi:hypothetical protein
MDAGAKSKPIVGTAQRHSPYVRKRRNDMAAVMNPFEGRRPETCRDDRKAFRGMRECV